MKKFFERISWKIYHWRWAFQSRFVPEFAIKFNRGIFRFNKTYGFGWLTLPNWEELDKQLQCYFEEQAGLVLTTLKTQKKMENELFRMGHASAWRYPEDNTLPYTPPEVVRVVLSDGRVIQQKIEIE